MYIIEDGAPFVLPTSIDRDSRLYYTFFLKPKIWTANTELIEGDFISPSVPTGYYYKVASSGVTGSVEPTWSTTANSRTEDNTVVYKAVNNTAYMKSTDTLNVVDSYFRCSDDVPILETQLYADGVAQVQVGPIPPGITKFTLTFSYYIDSGLSSEIHDERSIIIKVKDR